MTTYEVLTLLAQYGIFLVGLFAAMVSVVALAIKKK